MSTNYPGALDSFTNPTATDTLDSATVPHATQHANENDAIEAIQVTLGVNPQGGSATVVARLDSSDDVLASHTSSYTAHGATANNTASRIVLRDASGNFSAGTITATLNGNASSATTATTATSAGNATTVTNGVYTNVGNAFSTGTQVIATGADGTVGLRIKRNGASQTANLFEVTMSDGTSILASINPAGNITTSGTLTVNGAITGGSGSGTAGSLKLWGTGIGSSATITPPVLGSGATANQVLPIVGGTLVSTGMTGSNAQVTSGMIVDGTIVNSDINASAAIVDTKLDTIATAGKVSNSATTATSSNTASAIVARDSSGNFTAGTVSASVNAGSGGSVTTQTLNVNQGSTPVAVFKGASSSFSTTVQAQSSLAAANTVTLPSSTGTILTSVDSLNATNISSGSLDIAYGGTGHAYGSPLVGRAIIKTGRSKAANTTANEAVFWNDAGTSAVNLTVAENTTYAVEGFIRLTKPAMGTAGTAGFGLFYTSDGVNALTEQACSMSAIQFFTTPTIVELSASAANTSMNTTSVTGSFTYSLFFRGFIRTHATLAGKLNLFFTQSQAGTGGISAKVESGTYVNIYKLGTGSVSNFGNWA